MKTLSGDEVNDVSCIYMCTNLSSENEFYAQRRVKKFSHDFQT
jgi:hypothetical protein